MLGLSGMARNDQPCNLNRVDNPDPCVTASGAAADGGGAAQGAGLQLSSEAAAEESEEPWQQQQQQQQGATPAPPVQPRPLPSGGQARPGYRCSHCGSDYSSGSWGRHKATGQRLCCACIQYARKHAGNLPSEAVLTQRAGRRQRQLALQSAEGWEAVEQGQQVGEADEEPEGAQQAQQAAPQQLGAVQQPAVQPSHQQPFSSFPTEQPSPSAGPPAASTPAAQPELSALLQEATGVAAAAAAGLDGQLVTSFLALLATRPPQERAAKVSNRPLAM